MALTKAHNRMIEGASVSVMDFGAVGDGATDDSSAIVSASATGKYVFFPDGDYYINTVISPANTLWFGDGGAVIKMGTDGVISSSAGSIDVFNMKFHGPVTEAQYDDGIASSAISTAFDTPTYLDGSDSSYAGADFTHTKSTDTLTLNLASLTGTTRRSIESDYITLDSTKKYVVHLDEGFISSYASFGGITIRRYDGSNVYLGDYNPGGSGADLSLSSTHKIKIRIVLRRTSNMATTNPTSTVVDLSKIRFFKLVGTASTFDLTNMDQSHFQIANAREDVVISNCVFEYMAKTPLVIVSSKRTKISECIVRRSWGGFGSTNCTEMTLEGNKIDNRQLHTDGNLYNLKYQRKKAFGGTNTDYTTISNNYLRGANWGIEFTPMNGYKAVTINNVIISEIVGISNPGGDYTALNGNVIELAPGWAQYGIEIPNTHVDIDVSNNSITFLNPATNVAYGIGVTGATSDWKRGKFSDNKIFGAPEGMFLNNSGTALSTKLIVSNNDIDYGSAGIFIQKLNADIVGNTLNRVHDIVYEGAIVSAIGVGGPSLEVDVSNNTIQASSEYAMRILTGKSVVNNNTIECSSVLPAAISVDVGTDHLFSNNIFKGTVPTAYYSSSGSGTKRSLANRAVTGDGPGNIVLLGTLDEQYRYSLTSTGVGSPVVHSPSFTLPGRGTYIVNARTDVSGDGSNLVSGSFLVQIGNDLAYDMVRSDQIGNTAVSSGAPLVGSATMTLSVAITGVATFTITQSGGAAGSTVTTIVEVRKFIH
jgi:hypothetical protein